MCDLRHELSGPKFFFEFGSAFASLIHGEHPPLRLSADLDISRSAVARGEGALRGVLPQIGRRWSSLAPAEG